MKFISTYNKSLDSMVTRTIELHEHTSPVNLKKTSLDMEDESPYSYKVFRNLVFVVLRFLDA